MLNEDVLLLIIDHVDAMGDIASLSRVSHQFYRLAMPRLHRSMDLDLSLGSRAPVNLAGKQVCCCKESLRIEIMDAPPSPWQFWVFGGFR